MKKTQLMPETFPETFLWGAATSAHQIEGNTHNQWTVWELENATTLAKKAAENQTWLPDWEKSVKQEATNPENYVSGNATDHYNRYLEDFDLLTQFNMNAFRFSIEWSRIEPEEGVWNLEAIEHYRTYIKQLRSRGIEPVMTLMHWTLPVWFTNKAGFERRSNIKYFVRFAEKVLMELSSDIKYVCTINEPEVYMVEGWYNGNWPPNKQSKITALRVYMNLAHAHNSVARMSKTLNRQFYIGLSKNCAHHYAADKSWLSNVSAKSARWAADNFFLNKVARHCDWLGLNYYFSNRYYGASVKNATDRVNDLGWDMQPQNLQFVLERLYGKYKLPIMVTESGVADRNDAYRQWWIEESILAMQRAIQNGTKVVGYLHWSLLDNFEWASGKWPRFGLVHIDYKTLKRTPRDSAKWYGQVIKRLRNL